jgi:hypothetical protein
MDLFNKERNPLTAKFTNISQSVDLQNKFLCVLCAWVLNSVINRI